MSPAKDGRPDDDDADVDEPSGCSPQPVQQHAWRSHDARGLITIRAGASQVVMTSSLHARDCGVIAVSVEKRLRI
jgi:hypothetical protein